MKTKDCFRPRLGTVILATLVLLGPYLNLIFDIFTKDYKDLKVSSLLTFPCTILLTLYWVDYAYFKFTRKNRNN